MDEVGAQLEIVSSPSGWSLEGELDAHTAPSLADATRVVPPGIAEVDMVRVSFVDSSGLRVLLDVTNRARQAGGDVVLIAPQASIRRLIEISGLSDHVRVRD